MTMTWHDNLSVRLCNDNDMTWQSIKHDNDNWKCCSGWDWRCFQPGQPRSIMKRTCMPWTRSMKMRCIAMNAMNLHTTFLHAMNAVHERDMYAMNAINLHTTCCSCHECGPWTWRVCHECHESALIFFSRIVFFHLASLLSCYRFACTMQPSAHLQLYCAMLGYKLRTWQSPQS